MSSDTNAEWAALKVSLSKKYLADIDRLMKQDRAVAMEIAMYRGDTGVGAIQFRERVQTSTRGDAMESRIIRYMEQVEALEEWRRGAAKDIDRAMETVARVQGVPGNVLRSHYILGAKYKDIAFAIGYTERQVYRFAADGLCELYDYLPNDYKLPIHQAV